MKYLGLSGSRGYTVQLFQTIRVSSFGMIPKLLTTGMGDTVPVQDKMPPNIPPHSE